MKLGASIIAMLPHSVLAPTGTEKSRNLSGHCLRFVYIRFTTVCLTEITCKIILSGRTLDFLVRARAVKDAMMVMRFM